MNPVNETSQAGVGDVQVRRRFQLSTQTVTSLILLLIILLGAYLRLVGIGWDESTHLHPDERFLTSVESSLRLPASIGEYFDTENSLLNPHNTGNGFFVYGTFPIFLVRYLAEWVDQTGYDQVQIVGRAVSAAFDLISLLLIFCIGERLYSRRVGLLAALLGSMSVLLIQHAHFFVVDPIANVFILAGILFAVRAMQSGRVGEYLFFGAALGLSVASKISTAPLAATIVLAGLVRVLQSDPENRQAEFQRTLTYLTGAALISLLIFRVFQPYAFSGPGFFGLKPNPKWLANMAEIRQQQAGNTDAPYAFQWADRPPILFTLQNMLLWGLGLPLGIMAWIGWGWAALELFRKKDLRHLITVLWTGVFFIWQSIGFTKAMRYQLPIYPLLALFASWALFEAWDRVRASEGLKKQVGRPLVLGLAIVVVGGTALWAFAFTRIYRVTFTRAAASRWIYSTIPGAVNLVIDTEGTRSVEALPVPPDFSLAPDQTQILQIPNDILMRLEGWIVGILIPYTSIEGEAGNLYLSAEIRPDPNGEALFASTELRAYGSLGEEINLEGKLDIPIQVEGGDNLFLTLRNLGAISVAMRSTRLVHETTWDDGLPWGIDGRNLGGRYEVRNLELYWHDDQDDDQNGIPDKLERIVDYLAESEYITISSNRQYGTTTRVTARYPLTTAYYRALLDCPPDISVLACYATAQEGASGSLGYSLVKVFQSNPGLGPLEFNDQFAEEAFTVYDHPKVLIFKKDPDFDRERVFKLLSQVDVSQITHVLPKDAEVRTKDLMLPAARWSEQQTSGTWSEIFDLDRLINRSNLVATIVWWLAIGLLGLLVFPITRVALHGLQDQGYALSRLVGLVIYAWLSWMTGSLGMAVTRLTLILGIAILAGISAALAYRDREELRQFFRECWRSILWIEAFALIFFLVDLAIRYANPDLWKPGTGGGEKPMDFSYLNAVLKSATFPPYDPWFAGGYINYYYYGFVLVGMPIKLLGITPSVAYNLVLPTLFSLLALGAFSVAYNLVSGEKAILPWRPRPNARMAGILAALMLVVFGNLGTARMFYDGFKTIGRTAGQPEGTFIVGTAQAARGFFRYLSFQDTLPYPLDQWYWNPSRAITPGEGEAGPITEFPFFTFLYGDLHAHMVSRPLTILGLAWGLAWLRSAAGAKRRRLDLLLALGIGALTLGALRPTNTWDFPVYWVLGAAAVFFAPWFSDRPPGGKQILTAAAAALGLLLLAQYAYYPYHFWYGQGYLSADLWQGSHTPLVDYLTIHGGFLFVIVAWLAWEYREWMANTPLVQLARLRPYFAVISTAILFLIGFTGLLIGTGIESALIIIPLGTLTALLLLRPGLALGKRVALACIISALALTLLVEFVVLRGDLDRMNTVFKFYLMVWELLALAAAAAVAWVYAELGAWNRGWRLLWIVGSTTLIFSSALYPLTATPARIRDRFTQDAPRSLDGMAYLQAVDNYSELSTPLDLDEDYLAIRWMQENVQGTPVIVEANVPEYRFGSRFTIYTGLPGVLGWRWHQVQQRVAVGDQGVNQRLFDITDFYLTPSLGEASKFLSTYDVSYIIVGGLERAYYQFVEPCWPISGELGISCDLRGYAFGMPGTYDVSPGDCTPLESGNEAAGYRCPTHGLDKFEAMVESGLLTIAFETGGTTIYQVQR